MPAEASKALRNAPTIELFSLDPTIQDKMDDSTTFHGWKVLGSIKLSAGNNLDSLLDAFEEGIADHDGAVAACFDPRHGMRVTYQGKQHDFVICFRCYQAEWYIDDVKKEGFLLSRSPQSTFDKLLRDTAVKLPAPAD
jgi:hypothetical protein